MVKRKASKLKKASSARAIRNKSSSVQKSTASKARTDSKQAEVIGMLSRPQGITTAAIVKAIGWQRHSVRGFLAGVVRKKLGLALQSEKKDGKERVYRIIADKAPPPRSVPAKASAAAMDSQQAAQARVD